MISYPALRVWSEPRQNKVVVLFLSDKKAVCLDSAGSDMWRDGEIATAGKNLVGIHNPAWKPLTKFTIRNKDNHENH